jgi:hypothetical protein
MLVHWFGLFGTKKRYTVSTHLPNRLDVYWQKLYSILVPFTRYKENKFKDHQKATREEKGVFGSSLIAVFKKKPVTS